MDTHTLRTARALTWACVAATVIIAGIGTAQEDIALRAIIFTAALIPAAAAILIGSFIHDHTTGDTNNG
ncbi:hypothetical protein CO690_00700 [Rothia mucilaginosa]|uniref:Uncharacterized protein n=1 Tax=Rothia mucilaginosa TaxID=43675 RepID=A0A291DCT4_9MICC|nr:hypothetical protein [Rothia mucilaginosa]ATF62268.1 hypothetical protein CO690_00700 [Rothia mucilaginosa]